MRLCQGKVFVTKVKWHFFVNEVNIMKSYYAYFSKNNSVDLSCNAMNV